MGRSFPWDVLDLVNYIEVARIVNTLAINVALVPSTSTSTS